jgi:hypothetical protein
LQTDQAKLVLNVLRRLTIAWRSGLAAGQRRTRKKRDMVV